MDVNGQPLGQATIARYRFGEGELLAVVKEHQAIEGSIGRDGVTTYNDSQLGQIARQEVVVKLPRVWFVRDLRSGQSLGHTDTIRTSVVAGDALLLALSPERKTLSVRGPAAAMLGEHPTFYLVSSSPGKHLIRCHFFSPEGKFLFDYARNVLFDGTQGSVVLPSAFNDPPGTYQLKATDLLTGAETEVAIRLD
jgi:hypothetical protein